jgi:hypothetical protein
VQDDEREFLASRREADGIRRAGELALESRGSDVCVLLERDDELARES